MEVNDTANIVVRTAKGDESEAYVQVLLTAFPDKFASIFRGRNQEGSEVLIEHFADMQGKGHYIAELDGRIAGVLHLVTDEQRGDPPRRAFAFLKRLGPLRGSRALLAFAILSKRADSDECYVAHIAVRPENQGRGVGKLLIGTAERVAREKGRERLTLYVAGDNGPARSLYLARGFRTVRTDESSLADWLLGKRRWDFMVKELD